MRGRVVAQAAEASHQSDSTIGPMHADAPHQGEGEAARSAPCSLGNPAPAQRRCVRPGGTPTQLVVALAVDLGHERAVDEAEVLRACGEGLAPLGWRVAHACYEPQQRCQRQQQVVTWHGEEPRELRLGPSSAGEAQT